MVDHVTGGTLLCNRKPCECVGTVVRKSSVANLGNRHRVVGRFGGVPYCSNIFLLCSWHAFKKRRYLWLGAF